MVVVHREGCWYPKAIEENRRWSEHWPYACERCGGWGGFSFYDHDTGYQGYDPCPDCLERGYCPRCGGGVITEAYWDAGHVAICDNCSYVEATTPGEPPPVEDPCSCMGYFDEYERFIPHGSPPLPSPPDDLPF
jgi:hypothetical protein